jgi:hypothetical protein
VIRKIVDDQDGFCAVQFGVHDFAREQRMVSQSFAGEYTLFVILLRLMAQDNDYLVPRIDA